MNGKEEIGRMIAESPEKRISFSQYMEYALYHPEWGYYMKQRKKIGRRGDFYTNSSVHSLYGEIWADRFVKDWLSLHQGKFLPPFYLMEIGGGEGRFAKQVLDRIRSTHPHIYEAVRYLFVEGSKYHRDEAYHQLEEHRAKVVWLGGMSELPQDVKESPILVYSNELFDALPVERIRNRNGNLEECWVGLDREGRLREEWIPLQNQDIVRYLEEMRIHLPNQYLFEVPLVMHRVYREVVSSFRRGILYTVDYGYLFRDLLTPLHREGTLLGYRDHEHNTDPFDQPGETDLTTHVQFEALMKWGEEMGVTNLSFLSQREWLLQNGILERLIPHEGKDPFSPEARRNRAITQLILPGGMGDTFYCLTQVKREG